MKMKPPHKNARKVHYYVRMFAKELFDEVQKVIHDPSVTRRLTRNLCGHESKSLATDLTVIISESNDEELKSKLESRLRKCAGDSSAECLKEMQKCIRFNVPDDKVLWGTVYPEYKPPSFTAWSVLHTSLDINSPKPPWADEDFTIKSKEELKNVKFNQVDELHGKKIDRKSRDCSKYDLDAKTGLPLNPRGRTGLTGRGLLGRFGPNLAADPIVSRFKKENGKVKEIGGKKVLECVFVQRRDNNEWAIPGGMVEPGMEVSMTLVKEFREEALNVCHNDKEKAEQLTNELKSSLFSNGSTIYEGYVDDPRNTDNAWMETVAKNFHDKEGVTYKFQLEGGDDAFNAKWQECSSSLKLYASHKEFIEKTVKKHNAYW